MISVFWKLGVRIELLARNAQSTISGGPALGQCGATMGRAQLLAGNSSRADLQAAQRQRPAILLHGCSPAMWEPHDMQLVARVLRSG